VRQLATEDTLGDCINVSAREGEFFDHLPAVCTDASGRTWVAWTCYAERADAVMLRSVHDGEPGPMLTLSSVRGAEGAPCIVPFEQGVFVAWPALREGAWRIYGRVAGAEELGPEQCLSDGPGDLQPALAVNAHGHLLLAWRALTSDGPRIMLRAHTDEGWGDAVRVSEGPGPARRDRPRLAAGFAGGALAPRHERQDVLWIAWDAYFEGSYHVFAQRLDAETEAVQVSAAGQRQLLADLAVDAEGRPWLAWLEVADVATPDGVVDQHHYLCCARHDGDAWRLLTAEGMEHGRVADLAHGLTPNPTMRGYLGRRRNAMLLPTKADMALLWERKREQGGVTGDADGSLCARRWDEQGWSEACELQRGARCYAIDPGSGADGRVRWVAKSCGERREHHLVTGGAGFQPAGGREARPTEPALAPFEPALPWREVSLPLGDPPQREMIRAGDTEYQLFWADLHCHGVLSSDAEGEPDELLAYARDRAGLDVCALIDNDCYIVPMLNHEYRLGCQVANEFNDPGRFVALTGYEWTWRHEDNTTDHRYVLYPGECGPLVRWSDLEAPSIEVLAEEVASSDGIMHAHHHDWSLADLPVEANVEVCSGWGIYIDQPDVIHAHLDRGMRFGFTGSSDNHRRCPGLGGALTGIYATELTRWAIFEALVARHCYATTGERILLDFRVGDAVMGSEVVCEAAPRLSLSVRAPRPTERVQILRNGQVIYEHAPDAPQASVVFEDEDAPGGANYYYATVALAGWPEQYPSNVAVARGNRAWSSPIFVEQR